MSTDPRTRTTRTDIFWVFGCVLILLGLSVELAPLATAAIALTLGTALALKSIVDGWNQ